MQYVSIKNFLSGSRPPIKPSLVVAVTVYFGRVLLSEETFVILELRTRLDIWKKKQNHEPPDFRTDFSHKNKVYEH